MAERRIRVVMESSYKGDLTKKLRQDQKRLQAFQRVLDRSPLLIPVKLDLSSIKAQAQAVRGIVMGAVAQSSGGIVGPNGQRVSSASSSGAKGLLSSERTTVFGKKGESHFLTEVEQLGDGLKRVSKYKLDAQSGAATRLSETTKAVTNVAEMEQRLKNISRNLGPGLAAAAGRGDRSGQLSALRGMASQHDSLLKDAAQNGLVGSSVFAKAENKLDRLRDRIARTEGRDEKVHETAAQRAARQDKSRRVGNFITGEERRVQTSLKDNKLAMDAAERIKDRATREAEINRLYKEREGIFTRSRDTFRRLDTRLQQQGRPDLADRSMRRTLGMDNQANQAKLDGQRAETDQIKLAEKDRLKAHDEAQKQHQAQQKKAAEQAHASRENAFQRELQDIRSDSERRMAAIKRAETNLVRLAGKNKRRVQDIRELGHVARQAEYGRREGFYGGVEQRAGAAGHESIALTARGNRLAAGVGKERDMARMATTARNSGHALDFHSSSLLRNAATYARWMIPVQAVTGLMSAFNAGVAGAIRVDRQFATLRAVFRGTDQEAQRLKRSTLELAAAQGRGTEEAMDTAIRWSRLGMTRVQVLQATKVSLMAANVAEISAADAAEHLSAIYATYRLNVGDLEVVLGRLNAISNRYNVSNKDLLEGIARVSGVAKQSGMALEDLEGMIGAVVGASGRPGQEIGNAMKTIITRLASPEVQKGLKESFNIDLTDANGDLKDMSSIMKDLAAIYPTLNNAEKQYFLKLTAGSRQASRMAQAMTEYTQSQVLAAEAGMDTSSAFKENEKILSSLQSRIDALKSSWISFVTALGDAGWFKKAGEVARYLQLAVTSSEDTVASKKMTGKIKVNDVVQAGQIQAAGVKSRSLDALSNVGTYGLVGLLKTPDLFSVREEFTRDEIIKTRDAIEEHLKYRRGDSKEAEKMRGKSYRIGGVFDKTAKFTSLEQGEQAVAALNRLLEGDGQKAKMAEGNGTIAEANALRARTKAMGNASNAFEILGATIDSGKMDSKSMIRDFENSAHVLLNLEDGTNKYSNALSDFYRMLDSGDTEGISKLVKSLRELFVEDGKISEKSYAKVVAVAVPILHEKLKDLEKAKREAMKMPEDTDVEREARKSKLDENQTAFKNTQEALNQVTQAVDKVRESLYGQVGRGNINTFLDEIKAQAEEFRKVMDELSSDGDPVGRIYARKKSAASTGRNLLEDVRSNTAVKLEQRRAELKGFMQEEKDKAVPAGYYNVENVALEKQIALLEEAMLIANERVTQEGKLADAELRKLGIEERSAQVSRAISDGRKDAEASADAWRFGPTESAKDANVARAAIFRSGRMLNSLQRSDDPGSRAGAAGSVLADEATAKASLESMDRRRYQLAAERRQVEFDLVKALREQNEEAAKSFMMASREDQLRAAALSRTLGGKRVSGSQFFALSSESRQAMIGMAPGNVPMALSEPHRQAANARRDLDQEGRSLAAALGQIRRDLSGLSRSITAESGSHGKLDMTPRSTGDIHTAGMTSRDKSPLVNVSGVEVNVGITVAQEVKALVTDYVDRRFRQELSTLRKQLSGGKLPPTANSVAE